MGSSQLFGRYGSGVSCVEAAGRTLCQLVEVAPQQALGAFALRRFRPDHEFVRVHCVHVDQSSQTGLTYTPNEKSVDKSLQIMGQHVPRKMGKAVVVYGKSLMKW
jgi:hypothetical protein